MHVRRNQLTIAAVAFVLGLLVVVQLRTQASGAAFAGLSSQDLTVLVGNLNDRNDQLRREIASLQGELTALVSNRERGEVSLDELRADLRRVRLYAGIDPAVGPGVSILMRGPIDGSGVEDLINELRNAGAEAMAIDGIRCVPGVVVMGPPGAVDGRRHAPAGPVRDRRDRSARQADGVADPVRRDHRAARCHPARGHRGGHPGRAHDRPGDRARPRPGQRPAAALIPCPPCRLDPSCPCCSAMSCVSGGPIRAAATRGSWTGSAPTSACAARPVDGTSCWNARSWNAASSSSCPEATRR